MFKKKLSASILISCISASPFAAPIITDFTIENNTDDILRLILKQPNQQSDIPLLLPPQQPTTIRVTNHDGWGINKTDFARIEIWGAKDEKLYVEGQIVYNTSTLVWNRYSFLDSVSSAVGLNVDWVYSCRSGDGNTIFNNKLIIGGTPGNAIKATDLPTNVHCQGVKSSSMRDHSQYYTPVCFDGTSSIFWMNSHGPQTCNSKKGCVTWFTYLDDNKENLQIKVPGNISAEAIRTELDKLACGSH